MSKESHHSEFSKDSLGTDQALKYIWEFFQGHTFWIARISHWPDNSKGPITDRPIRHIFTSRHTIAWAWKTKMKSREIPKVQNIKAAIWHFFLKGDFGKKGLFGWQQFIWWVIAQAWKITWTLHLYQRMLNKFVFILVFGNPYSLHTFQGF